ncbi:MAG: DUF2924 domain-containing protein [Candidatus Omnitrophica bacterium]|nr:DUF2924 domain-containing protein [Candidatus Omnitrophota bacterium]
MNEDVSGQIESLKQIPQDELIAKYSALFGNTRPHSKNTEYLRKKIANKIQEMAYGGISETAKKRLEQLILFYDPINNKLLRQISNSQELPGKQTRDKRLPIPGTIITKIYKGTVIKVKVLDKGFEYEERYYKSLSILANSITGAHGNGYLFFGLQERYGKRNKNN